MTLRIGGALWAHLRYLSYVLRHKWYVLKGCRVLGLPLWVGIVHDWTKFLPSEWFAYVRFFYGPDGQPRQRRDSTGYYKPTDTGDPRFDFAWFLHQKRNPHHWQWWVLPVDGGGVKALPIPDRYVREMVADWYGAGRAQGTPDIWRWFKANRSRMLLHPETVDWIEYALVLLEKRLGKRGVRVMKDERPTVCVDLDGVLNQYDGWRGEHHFPAPRMGARDFLQRLYECGYRVVILTTRDIDRTWSWLREHEMGLYVAYVTNNKPPAVAYIDDRAICFRGDFEATLAELEGFRTHWEQPEGEG